MSLHSYNAIHAHLKPENMLLDEHYELKIIDLSGSSIDGKPPFRAHGSICLGV